MATSSGWGDLLTSTWDIERHFDPEPWQRWLKREGMAQWFFCTVLYLVIIFYGRKLMETRPRMELRVPLALWNFALALFSLVSAWRLSITAYEMLARPNLWHTFVCDAECYDQGRQSTFWLLLFSLSKMAEYGDTVFIVLRKSKLLLLHWYHHIITFLVGYHTYAYRNPTLFLSALMNVYVHSIMYSYYGLRVVGVRVPKRIAMVITSIQIIQLMVGTYVQFYAAWAFFVSGVPCHVELFTVIVGSFGYASVLLLFIKFFIQTYFIKRHSHQQNSVDTRKEQ